MIPTPREKAEHRAYQRRLFASGVIPPKRITWEHIEDLIHAAEVAFKRSGMADMREAHRQIRAKLKAGGGPSCSSRGGPR